MDDKSTLLNINEKDTVDEIIYFIYSSLTEPNSYPFYAYTPETC